MARPHFSGEAYAADSPTRCQYFRWPSDMGVVHATEEEGRKLVWQSLVYGTLGRLAFSTALAGSGIFSALFMAAYTKIDCALFGEICSTDNLPGTTKSRPYVLMAGEERHTGCRKSKGTRHRLQMQLRSRTWRTCDMI